MTEQRMKVQSALLWVLGILVSVLIGLVGTIYSGVDKRIDSKASKESVVSLGDRLESIDKKLDILIEKR